LTALRKTSNRSVRNFFPVTAVFEPPIPWRLSMCDVVGRNLRRRTESSDHGWPTPSSRCVTIAVGRSKTGACPL